MGHSSLQRKPQEATKGENAHPGHRDPGEKSLPSPTAGGQAAQRPSERTAPQLGASSEAGGAGVPARLRGCPLPPAGTPAGAAAVGEVLGPPGG